MLKNFKEILNFFKQTDEFISAVQYTTELYGFTSNLIEKDYLCSLILNYLSEKDIPLIFKGGTLLSKGYAKFYRLSEDLDFTISTPKNASRNERSRYVRPIKNLLNNNISQQLPVFTIEKPLVGHNDSSQYTMSLNYQSQVTGKIDRILIDISLREETIQPAQLTPIKTLLSDPFLQKEKCSMFHILSLTQMEAYAEKTRAALCRRKLAIRDLYDLDYAIENHLIDMRDKAFIDLIKIKIMQEANEHDLASPSNLQYLHEKIEAELKPTLKYSEIDSFNLERIINRLNKILQSLRVN